MAVRPRRRWIPPVLAASLVLLLARCGEGPVDPNERVASISVSPDSAVLSEVGSSETFSATARDESGGRVTGVTFEWTSSDPTVATVTPGGTATSESEGRTTITASAGGVSGSATLRVDEPAEPSGTPPQDSRVVKGQVVVPEGSQVSPRGLTVASFASQDTTDESGDYAVYVQDAQAPSFIAAFSEDGDPVMITAAFPDEGNVAGQGDRAWSELLASEVRTDARATAEALVLASPVFGGASADDYQRARRQLRDSPRFEDFVSRVESYLRTPSEVEQGLFGDDVYPPLARSAEEVARSVLGGGSSARAELAQDIGPTGDDPSFDQNGDDELVVTNPDLVVRGANFTDAVSGSEQGFIVPRASVDWVFDVPPLQITDAREALGRVDGIHNVWMSTGLNLDDPVDAENWKPAVTNLAILSTQILELWGPDIPGLEDLPDCIVEQVSSTGTSSFRNIVSQLAAVRDNGGLSGVAVNTVVSAAVGHVQACVPAIVGTKLEDAYAQIFKSVWNSAMKVVSAGKTVQFVNDWFVEDGVTGSPLPGGLGGTYTERYALRSGSGLRVSRGGAFYLDWSPEKGGEFVLDGAGTSVPGPPVRRYGLKKGAHEWTLRGDFQTESGSFEVQRAKWHPVTVDLVTAVDLAVSPKSASLALNQTQQFTATGLDEDGNEVDLSEDPTWRSTEPSVAEVNDSGVAAAKAPGTTEIVAEVDGVGSDRATLEVIDAEATPSASGGDGDFSPEDDDSGDMELCVAVYGPDGEKIQGLTAADYSIPDVSVDGGTLRFTARSVSTPSCPNRGPLSAALVVDQSGSMADSDSENARLTAVKQFTREMDSGGEAALFSFSTTVRRETGFRPPPTGLDAAVNSLGAPDGRTAMYDAGIEACRFVAENGVNSNKAVMLLSDGMDNESTSSLSELVSRCNSLGVRVYTAGFADSPPQNLATIAARASGRAIFSETVDIILSAIRALPATMRGDICPDCVDFDVLADGYDLTQGGSASGTVTADVSAAVSADAQLVVFRNSTVDAVNTVSAPWQAEWSSTSGGNGDAKTIDFEDLSPGRYGATLDLDGVTIRSRAEDVGVTDGSADWHSQMVCSVTSADTCDGVIEFDFDGPVDDLTFDMEGDDEQGRIAVVEIYRDGSLVETREPTGDGEQEPAEDVDLSDIEDIDRVVITPDDPAGIAYDNLSFRLPASSKGALKEADGTTPRPRSDEVPRVTGSGGP